MYLLYIIYVRALFLRTILDTIYIFSLSNTLKPLFPPKVERSQDDRRGKQTPSPSAFSLADFILPGPSKKATGSRSPRKTKSRIKVAINVLF